MRKWQYRAEYISQQPSEEGQSMRYINKLGEEGWEMMSCHEVGHRLLKAIFKRELPQIEETQD